VLQSTPSDATASSDNENEWRSTSTDFAMDPLSKKAKAVMNHLGLSVEQHQKLAKLAVLVTDWNTKLNLISRRDCSKEVVFGRHIIPSLAPLGLEGENGIIKDNQRVVDVGTGGGFPGLPLAIAYPDVDFLLVDSIGKKLGAVQDMADTLGLTNVKTHHGRAEQLKQKFDICIGRSVAPIPTFCFWIQDLLERDGHLQYIVGGEIEQNLLDQSIIDSNVDDLLECPNASDKRILVFPRATVKKIAKASGEKSRVSSQVAANPKKKVKRTKGAWDKNDPTKPKQRGYENFKRFDSTL
jgi:16S rRNA (guanine527-N7)-methyltransferase